MSADKTALPVPEEEDIQHLDVRNEASLLLQKQKSDLETAKSVASSVQFVVQVYVQVSVFLHHLHLFLQYGNSESAHSQSS